MIPDIKRQGRINRLGVQTYMGFPVYHAQAYFYASSYVVVSAAFEERESWAGECCNHEGPCK